MTGSLFPFVRRLVLFHFFHFGDWDLCFFPVSWELFNVESGQYRIDARCVRLFLGLCTGRPLASDFTIFGVFCFVCFVALVLFFCLDEDCNPGWGDCGRPLRLLLLVLLKMVNGRLRFVHWRLDH